MIFQKEVESFIENVHANLFKKESSDYTVAMSQNEESSQSFPNPALFFISSKDNRLLFVVKVFYEERDTLERFATILTAAEFLATLDIKKAYLVHIFAYKRVNQDSKHATLMAIEAAPGIAINHLLSSEYGEKSIALLGSFLTELHSFNVEKGQYLSPYYVDLCAQIFANGTKAIYKHNEEYAINIASLTAKYLSLWDQIRHKPPQLGYVLGEPHLLKHVFYDTNLNQLTLTKFDRLAYSLDKDKFPSGPIALDFAWTRLSLQMAMHTHNLSEKELHHLDQTFVQNYQMEGTMPSDEEQAYYTFIYWMNILSLSEEESHVFPAKKDPIAMQQQMAVTYLKNLISG